MSRRILADFTDAQFIGNEWASVGLLVGTVSSYLLNPVLEGNVVSMAAATATIVTALSVTPGFG